MTRCRPKIRVVTAMAAVVTMASACGVVSEWGRLLLAQVAHAGQEASLTAVQLDLEGEWRGQFDELAQLIAMKRDASQNPESPWRRRFKRVEAEVFRRDALILADDRDPAEVAIRRVAALLENLHTRSEAGALAAERGAIERLQKAAAETLVRDAKRRYGLYLSACRLRGRIAFSNPLLTFDRILFLKRHRSKVDHMCDQYFGFTAQTGGGVFILHDPFGPNPRLQDLLADSVVENGRLRGKKLISGSFVSPELSFDGKTILFAYTEIGPRIQYHNLAGGWGRPESCYHVFRVNVDGTGLRQLTDGGFNDFDPCFLPNGRVAFISERRGGFGRCHGHRNVPTYTLHTMNPDGSDIVPISYHETNEWHPSVTNTGMIIYTRWDYVDRGSNEAHHPWIVYPDGRDPRAIHGNYRFEGKRWPSRARMELDYRAIPGSAKYVGTAAGHHGQAYGSLIVLDTARRETETDSQLRRLTPEITWPENESPWREAYGTAWPLSEDYYLCVYSRAPDQHERSRAIRARKKVPPFPPYKLYLLDSFGNKVLLYEDPEISCLGPIPLEPRPVPPVLPHLTNIGKPGRVAELPRDVEATGVFACVNVYDSLLPWPEGTKIKALRVVQLYPFYYANGPPAGHIHMSMARGVVGTVPVEEDGSVHFEAPAGKVLYFQALDEDGLAVQSMKSAAYLTPSERLVCQGCHEPRYNAPRPVGVAPLALCRAPSRIQPDVPDTRPISFPRLVQPVLDRQCVACHDRHAEAPDLSRRPARADRPLGFPASYANLVKDVWAPRGTRSVPGRVGARASTLYRIITADHYGLELSKEDLHRLSVWMDTTSVFYGAYRDRQAQLHGESVVPCLE